MKVNQYDKVKLKTGETATIVEVLESEKAFIADIERNNDIDTAHLKIDEIEKII